MPAPLSNDRLLGLLKDAAQPMTKRDVARALGIKGGADRVTLKQLLKELEQSGQIVKQPGGAFSVPQGLPAVTLIEITETDVDGDLFARPVDTVADPPPVIEVRPGGKGHPGLMPGDRALAELKKLEDGLYAARVIRRLDRDAAGADTVIGLVTRHKQLWTLAPADKKAKYDFEIPQADLNGAEEGDLAVGQIMPARGTKRKKARITEVIGPSTDPKAISMLSAHEVGLRVHFPAEALKETEALSVPGLKGREDLRQVPLITIDGADAKDFDDAVFAEETEEGFHLIVAIADVSYYVRPGSALDREAQQRGNSTYFPDRVIPMLPPAISDDLCSLRPDEPRACLAAHLWIDPKGTLRKYKFVRGLMRSHARCTYEEVQEIREHGPQNTRQNMIAELTKPLYSAFAVLEKAREHRGALDLDLPERRVLINESGEMTGLETRQRLDAHKLIEEMMILANVAAARALEDKKAPCVYRVHEPPKADRIASASDFLEGFGLSLPKGQAIKPANLNQILKKADALPAKHLIHQVLLRTQAQAHYNPQNHGHFGLALTRYAHFTSPIRRYADLLVHRSLVGAYGLGPGPLSETEAVTLEAISEEISNYERKSIEAERNATDRFTAAYMARLVEKGEIAEFAGRINGVTRFGLFVTLEDSGADGLIPIRALKGPKGGEYYRHDEASHALIGERTGTTWRLGATLRVKLVEADGLTGSLILAPVDPKAGADLEGFKAPKRSQGRGPQSRAEHKKYRGTRGGAKKNGPSGKHKNSLKKSKKSFKKK